MKNFLCGVANFILFFFLKFFFCRRQQRNGDNENSDNETTRLFKKNNTQTRNWMLIGNPFVCLFFANPKTKTRWWRPCFVCVIVQPIVNGNKEKSDCCHLTFSYSTCNTFKRPTYSGRCRSFFLSFFTLPTRNDVHLLS